jgi:hypothetical protein
MAGLLLTAIALPVQAGPISPGQSNPGNPDPFIFNFDENGNGIISIDGGPFIPNNGTLQPDPSNGGKLALTYFLPASQLPGEEGDVLIYESPGVLSDVIRFTDADGNLDLGTGDRMIYYSDIGDADLALADTGFPSNLDLSSISVNETGPEGANGFTYGTPNIFNGVSDGRLAVPEPGSLIMLTSSVLGLALASLRRRLWTLTNAACGSKSPGWPAPHSAACCNGRIAARICIS